MYLSGIRGQPERIARHDASMARNQKQLAPDGGGRTSCSGMPTCNARFCLCSCAPWSNACVRTVRAQALRPGSKPPTAPDASACSAIAPGHCSPWSGCANSIRIASSTTNPGPVPAPRPRWPPRRCSWSTAPPLRCRHRASTVTATSACWRERQVRRNFRGYRERPKMARTCPPRFGGHRRLQLRCCR